MGAVKALGQAFDLDPTIADDEKVRKLAAAITKLPPDEAVATMLDHDRRDAFILQKGQSLNHGRSSIPVLYIVGVVLLILFVLIPTIIVNTNTDIRDAILSNIGVTSGTPEQRAVDGYPEVTYHIGVPNGRMPEDGWPTLIAIHDEGQTGQDMMDALYNKTRSNGILLIAPNLPNLADYRDSQAFYGVRGSILLILHDVQIRGVSARLPASMHYRGQVYFGRGMGADFVGLLASQGLDYSDVGFSLDVPLGVALADATGYYMPFSEFTPYLIASPEDSPALTQFMIALEENGNPVDYHTSSDYGGLVIDFVKGVYNLRD